VLEANLTKLYIISERNNVRVWGLRPQPPEANKGSEFLTLRRFFTVFF